MSESDTNMAHRDEMEALLPFYLNGTLDGADLAAVEAWLANDPAGAKALEEAEAELFGATAVNEALRPPGDALGRFSKALEREAGPARAAGSAPVFAGLWQRIAGLPAGLAWATAAAAIALVLVQAVGDFRNSGGDYQVAGDGNDLGTLPFVLVAFKPDAGMAAITAFLDENDASIAGGPTAGGVFRIALPVKTVADYDRVLALIAAAPFVQSATAGRKPSNGE